MIMTGLSSGFLVMTLRCLRILLRGAYDLQLRLWKKLDHVICTEHRVCSDEGDVPFAGTLDGLFKISGQIVLFDLKTKAEGKAKPAKQINNEAMCQLQACRICLLGELRDTCGSLHRALRLPDKAPHPVAASDKQFKEHEEHWARRCEAYQLINELAACVRTIGSEGSLNCLCRSQFPFGLPVHQKTGISISACADECFKGD